MERPQAEAELRGGGIALAASDTHSTLHKATLHDPATTPETRRLLWRVSVTGKAPIYERTAADP
jgi:hypothetical protein